MSKKSSKKEVLQANSKQEKTKSDKPKQDKPDIKADTGEFQKGRAGPKDTISGKKTAQKKRSGGQQKKSQFKSEAQETFVSNPKHIAETSEEKSRKANSEFFGKHENEDENDVEYASEREESRAKRKHRQRLSRARVKDNFILSDTEFNDKDSFLKKPGIKNGKTGMIRESAKKKTFVDTPENVRLTRRKAMKKRMQRSQYKLVKHFDKKTGETTYELQTNKVRDHQNKDFVGAAAGLTAMEATGFLHQKVSEYEDDNSAVEAAHKSEEAAETIASTTGRARKQRYSHRADKVSEAERRQFKADHDFRSRGNTGEHPENKTKVRQKQIQKQRIKREYSKAMSKGKQAEQAAEYAQKAAEKTTDMARKVIEFVRKHAGVIGIVGLFALFFMMIIATMSSCAAMFGSGMTTTMSGGYQSEPAQLDSCDDALSQRELELKNTIKNIKADNPGYDEYKFSFATIGHDPYILINYLSALYGDVDAAEADSEIESLFNSMYTLTLTPCEETRIKYVKRSRRVYDPATKSYYTDVYYVPKEYTVQVLYATLTKKDLEEVVADKLSGNAEAKALYDVYQNTHGALQQFFSPLSMDWYSKVTSYYGYRENPITKESEYHRGVDIVVPTGTKVYAAQSGTVTEADYDTDYGKYIVIEDDKGFVTKYAHLESMNVSAGQTIRCGEVIGKTGNTGKTGVRIGSCLHLECMADGEYYNPLFYFENGKD